MTDSDSYDPIANLQESTHKSCIQKEKIKARKKKTRNLRSTVTYLNSDTNDSKDEATTYFGVLVLLLLKLLLESQWMGLQGLNNNSRVVVCNL